MLPLLGQCFPHTLPYLTFVTRRQAGSLLGLNWLRSFQSGASLVKSLICRKDFRLVLLTTNERERCSHGFVSRHLHGF